MRWFKRLFHPLSTLIAINLVWVLLVVLWIIWFVGRDKEFRALAERYRPELLGQGFDWVVLVEGLVLLVVVLAGVYAVFLSWRRQSRLYAEQRDFITQVTHELKSPLASIQLHLETIRLRRPEPDKLERFLDTMLADTERLNGLISNLLLAARLEQQHQPSAPLTVVDFSAFISRSLEQKRKTLPEGGSLVLTIEPGLSVPLNLETMETALRNLFENAVLYSGATPEINVSLAHRGRQCILRFSDRGRGIEPRELKQVFRMFYRVRQPRETIRGSGLGLYIVKSVVEQHGGTVQAESAGLGQGTTFTIALPLAGDKGHEDRDPEPGSEE